MNETEYKYKILLVEDEPNIARLFNYVLSKAGYNIIFAENGLVGYNKVKAEKPDLIISDIMMPEVDGFEFRKMLLADLQVASVPFVFLTAKGTEDDILEGYNMAIEDYIIKTSSPKIVLAKIDSIFKSIKREREKAVEEVQNAADSLRTALAPENPPKFVGFKINQYYQPFEKIPGGDFIDYIQLDENNLVVILGDVMGKKWGAWYFAVAYAGYVRSAVRFVFQSNNNISAKDIMEKINQSIYNDERISEVFITLSILIINNKQNSIKYCGAGDLPLLLINEKAESIKSEGVLLGLSDSGKYEDVEFILNPESKLYLFTDGIIETRNNAGELFGIERLGNLLTTSIKEENSLTEVIKEFSNYANKKFEDDISVIEITRD
ncbi:MAG: fused response regulator/phosphatase [bacterium]